MRWTELVNEVRERGQYPTIEEAERTTRTVLSAFGGQVTGEERVDLARRLPPEAAGVLVAQVPAVRPLTAAEFVDDVAAKSEGSTAATARWDVSSVLTVAADVVGDDLIDRLVRELPMGYALLFGRAQLVIRSPRAAAAPAGREPQPV